MKHLCSRMARVVAAAFGVSLVALAALHPSLLTRTPPSYTSKQPRVTRHSPAPSCRALFTIRKKSDSNLIWDKVESYAALSHRLPPLLVESLSKKDSTKNMTQSAETDCVTCFSSPSSSSFSSSSSLSKSSSFAAFPGTRLHLTSGSVPYIPCKVREYGMDEVGRCVEARAASGASTWITLVGDSHHRQKIHALLTFLPPHLSYTYYLGDMEVSRENFTLAVAHHRHRPPSFDVIGRLPSDEHDRTTPTTPTTTTSTTNSHNQPPPNTDSFPYSVEISAAADSGGTDHTIFRSFPSEEKDASKATFTYSHEPLMEREMKGVTYDLRVTLVWAPCGTRMGHPLDRTSRKVIKLQDLAEAKVVPDVITLGFGTWPILMREYDDEVSPFSELDVLFRPLVPSLTALAARTPVLYWTKSRYRGFNYVMDRKWATNESSGDYAKSYWTNMMYFSQLEDSISLVDQWLWGILRRTGAWLWDSSLPFNLANLRECRRLNEAGMSSHSAYKARWWNCNDPKHDSYETNIVEIQMLLNLLCNSPLDSPSEYCCAAEDVT